MIKNITITLILMISMSCSYPSFYVDYMHEEEKATVNKVVTVSGKAEGGIVTINSKEIPVDKNGRFTHSHLLKLGLNEIIVEYNKDGQITKQTKIVKRITQAEQDKKILEEKCSKYTFFEMLDIKKSSWRAGGFGSVGIHKVKVFNPCPITVKDIIFEVSYFAKSGTKLNANKYTVYEAIPPKGTKLLEFSGLMNSQSNTSRVEIVGAKK